MTAPCCPPEKACCATAVASARGLLRTGRPLGEALSALVREAERVAGHESTCSIMLLDADGLLRNMASPGLPDDYLRAIDGLKPDPDVGTCAAVAATGVSVVTPDFMHDDRWAELRHLPLALGYLSAWSTPIFTPGGVLLGTFGTYYRSRRIPLDTERTCVEQLASRAGEMLARYPGALAPAIHQGFSPATSA